MDIPAWLIPIVAGIPTTFASMFGVVWAYKRFMREADDKREDRVLTYEEKRQSEMIRERERIAADNADIITGLKEEAERYKEENQDYRNTIRQQATERFQAWDRAYFWHRKTLEFRNEVAYCRQVAESAARLAGHPVPIWGMSLDIPPFDDQVRAPLPSLIKANKGELNG